MTYKIRLVVQPTVSHYREPLLHYLTQSSRLSFSLVGRYSNADKKHGRNAIKNADVDILAHVDELEVFNIGPMRWERGILSSIWTRKYDAFVLEGRSYTLSTWFALIAGRLRKVPVCLWGHGWKRPERGLKLATRVVFYKLSQGLLLYGNRAREFALKAGIRPERAAVVGNSIYSFKDLTSRPGEEPTSVPNDNNTFNIIISARLTPRHNIHLLADAISLLPDGGQGMNVTIIGEGTEREALETYFKDKEIRAHFVGAVYGAEALAPYYARADAAVSPRASGLNIVQALGFAVPVIAPAEDPTSGPESELVENGKTGAIFRLDDAEDLARRLLEFQEAPLRTRTMGIEGKKQILQTHTAEAHGAAIENALLDFNGC